MFFKALPEWSWRIPHCHSLRSRERGLEPWGPWLVSKGVRHTKPRVGWDERTIPLWTKKSINWECTWLDYCVPFCLRSHETQVFNQFTINWTHCRFLEVCWPLPGQACRRSWTSVPWCRTLNHNGASFKPEMANLGTSSAHFLDQRALQRGSFCLALST